MKWMNLRSDQHVGSFFLFEPMTFDNLLSRHLYEPGLIRTDRSSKSNLVIRFCHCFSSV